MKQVVLNRFIDDGKQTLGILTTQGPKELFIAKSLELSYNNNLNNISCIPPGAYPCQWTRSNRLSQLAGHDVYTYEVLNVLGRAGIRIHSANYFFQLKGCIALGNALKDINMDNHLDVIHSSDTVNRFNVLMNKEGFRLVICNG